MRSSTRGQQMMAAIALNHSTVVVEQADAASATTAAITTAVTLHQNEVEPVRILDHYLQSIADGRIKDALAPNCKLRWFNGKAARKPTMVNEFLRFHVTPKYTHSRFDGCKHCDAQQVLELQKRYSLQSTTSSVASKKMQRVRDLNSIVAGVRGRLRNRADSDTEEELSTTATYNSQHLNVDNETLLCEEEQTHLERMPTTSSHIAVAQQLHYIEANGELHAIDNVYNDIDDVSDAASAAAAAASAIINVRLLLVYTYNVRINIPEFVFVAYERTDDIARRRATSVRVNLCARLDAAAAAADTAAENSIDIGSASVDDDDIITSTINRSAVPVMPELAQTPDRSPSSSSTPATPSSSISRCFMTPNSVSSGGEYESPILGSTARKRQHNERGSSAAVLQHKRKAMRRLRL